MILLLCLALLLGPPVMRAQAVAPGTGTSCPHQTANSLGEFCYDTPSAQFTYSCDNFHDVICNCEPSASILYTYTVQNCCQKCGCCQEAGPPPPPARAPHPPPPPATPPPALPHVDDWWTIISGSWFLPSNSMVPDEVTTVPGIAGYSKANEAYAMKWCLSVAIDPATRQHESITNTYAITYFGADGPNCKPVGFQGDVEWPMMSHECSTSQSSNHRWHCQHREPGCIDSPHGKYMSADASVQNGMGFCDCSIDIGGWSSVNTEMPGCVWFGYDYAYTFWRSSASYQWQADIDAGLAANSIFLPTRPPKPPSLPPYPPFKAPSPSPAAPDRQRDALVCFSGPIEGLWSETTGSVSSGTTDLYLAKIICLDSYDCTAITTNIPGVTAWTLVYTCRTTPVACQLPRGNNGVSHVAESFYRLNPPGEHGCWFEGPYNPPSPPPPRASCYNRLSDYACARSYRFAGMCHVHEAIRDCQLTCGHCSGGCIDRDSMLTNTDGGACAVEGAVQCMRNGEFHVTSDVSPANGVADGMDSKCTQSVGLGCPQSCGCEPSPAPRARERGLTARGSSAQAVTTLTGISTFPVCLHPRPCASTLATSTARRRSPLWVVTVAEQ